jgi:hypothetical protein
MNTIVGHIFDAATLFAAIFFMLIAYTALAITNEAEQALFRAAICAVLCILYTIRVKRSD